MITVFTNDDPKKFYHSIQEAVKNGNIDTWEETTRNYFTHCAASGQWRNKAWFTPNFPDEQNRVIFNLIRPKNEKISKSVYAIYHGRFTEMLLRHFDDKFSKLSVSALAGENDRV